jgi:hypothetical protein
MKPETQKVLPKLIGFYRSLGCTIEDNQFFIPLAKTDVLFPLPPPYRCLALNLVHTA